MGRKRKYRNVAEKQRAWRIRHGQPRKVSLALRRGERTGASETELREKKDGESWEEYHKYLLASVYTARKRQEKAKGAVHDVKEEKPGGGVRDAKTFPSDYYETQREYELSLEEAVKKGGKFKQKRRKEKI